MARHTDASEIYGISERELYDEWRAQDSAISLADWLRDGYQALGDANPDGGWDEANMPDFDALARQIERVVA
jgi:hypothetical protein